MKLSADIAIEHDGTALQLRVEGNVPDNATLHDVGAFLSRRFDQQIGKLFGLAGKQPAKRAGGSHAER